MGSESYVITPTMPDAKATDAPPAVNLRKMDTTFKSLYPIEFHFPLSGKAFCVPRAGLPAESKRIDELYKKHMQHTPWDKHKCPSVGNPGNWDNDFLGPTTAEEFRSLLKLTCRFATEEPEELTVNDWMAVLKLAKRWDMPDTHVQAVNGVEEEIRKKSAAEKIFLAKRFDVERWFREGFAAFVTGKEHISIAERDELGWETYARLVEARDKAWFKSAVDYQKSLTGRICSCKVSCPTCSRLVNPEEPLVQAGLVHADCDQLFEEAFGSS